MVAQVPELVLDVQEVQYHHFPWLVYYHHPENHLHGEGLDWAGDGHQCLLGEVHVELNLGSSFVSHSGSMAESF